MDQIQIYFEATEILDLSISLNNNNIEYYIVDNRIIIDTEVMFGLNLLQITARGLTDKIIITDFSLNSASSRQTLYLAYQNANDTSVSSTWLTPTNSQLTIPFGNPISWWLSLCSKKIPNSYFGTNLYEKFNILYPDSIVLPGSMPRLMQDFMRYNFGFYLTDKQQPAYKNKNLPWIKSTLEYDETALYSEFKNNIEKLNATYYVPKQNYYNKKENKNNKIWHVSAIVHDEIVEEMNRCDFPNLFGLIDSIKEQGVKILHVWVGTIHPDSYASPHVDDFYKNTAGYESTFGCSQFFIPIGWGSNNYFKFEDVGFLPYEQGAFIVNNSDFVHASVNLSDSTRFTIGIYCEFTEENFKFFSID